MLDFIPFKIYPLRTENLIIKQYFDIGLLPRTAKYFRLVCPFKELRQEFFSYLTWKCIHSPQ